MKQKLKYHLDWENLAQLDPEWAIVTDPSKKYGKWDEEEFFEIGEKKIQILLTKTKRLDIKIKFEEALDFGCGIGRLTRALSKRFDKVYGVDISKTMISIAKELHKENKNIVFLQNTANDLSCFESNKFDLVYSIITLQHIPEQNDIKNYLLEFLRILKPGGLLYFQLPTVPGYTNLKSILLRVRGHIYYLFVKIGVPKEYCFRYLRLGPYIHMNYLRTHEIKALFSEGANILQIHGKTTSPKYLIQKRSTSTSLKKDT